MRLKIVIVAGLFLTGSLCADVITPKKGAPFKGTVVSMDEKSVTVKTEDETRVIERSAIRKIEFGDVLMTGLQGREYTNADYRLRISVPQSWTPMSKGQGEFAARKNACSFTLQGLTAGDMVVADKQILGAINGMKSSVPGSEFTNLVDATFSGIPFRRTSVKSPSLDGVVLFATRGSHLVMFLALSESKAQAAESCLADWDGKIRFVEE